MTKKINNGAKRFIMNLKSFSLVELIIVIAIIAILSVAGFLTLQKRISQSRDSKRLGDLETIEKSLTVNYTDQDTAESYPMPDENNDGSEVTAGTIDGETVAYKGTFGSGAIENVDNLNEVPVDPLDDDRYAYGVTKDQQYFQIAVVLENGKKVSLNITNRAYAADKKSTVRGNYDGLMVYTKGESNYISNIPSLIFNNTGSLTDTGVVSYVVDGSSNLAYGDTTQKESFEEVVRKTYGLSGEASVSFVNTGTDSLKQVIEDDSINDTMRNSLGGNEGVIEAKLEESGVSVDSSNNKEWNLSGTRNDKYEHDGYNVLVFKDVGNHNLEVEKCAGDCEMNVLIVAGGGSGGSQTTYSILGSAGGGAGGLVFLENHNVNKGESYDIIVGRGGKGISSNGGNNGENSSAFGINAVGGGYGVGREGGNATPGDGGSGGGSRDAYIGSGIEGQGNDGNDAFDDNDVGGGGGGASQKGGENGKSYGGDGKYFGDVFGEKYGENGWFAGGGGGGNEVSSNGGKGGGGDGALKEDNPGGNAMPNTGGGGGGETSGNQNERKGGDGGSGIVLISYPKNN